MNDRYLARSVALCLASIVASSAAGAADITYDDLQGATIEAKVVYERTFKRDGMRRQNENHTTVILQVGPGTTLQQTHKVAIVARDGRIVGERSRSLTLELNKPRDYAEGNIVWIFENGGLTRLQTFAAGGRRLGITFVRDAGGALKCTFVAPFAREDGVGAVETDAVVRPGAAVEWLDIKQKSTSCLVSKAS